VTPAEARALLDAAVERATDPDKRARLELAREFLCNPEFSKALADYSFARTK
jgi:hypothetical protein